MIYTWSVGNDEHPATIVHWIEDEKNGTWRPYDLIGTGEIRVMWVGGTACVYDRTITRERLQALLALHEAVAEYTYGFRPGYTLGKVELPKE